MRLRDFPGIILYSGSSPHNETNVITSPLPNRLSILWAGTVPTGSRMPISLRTSYHTMQNDAITHPRNQETIQSNSTRSEFQPVVRLPDSSYLMKSAPTLP